MHTMNLIFYLTPSLPHYFSFILDYLYHYLNVTLFVLLIYFPLIKSLLLLKSLCISSYTLTFNDEYDYK